MTLARICTWLKGLFENRTCSNGLFGNHTCSNGLINQIDFLITVLQFRFVLRDKRLFHIAFQVLFYAVGILFETYDSIFSTLLVSTSDTGNTILDYSS